MEMQLSNKMTTNPVTMEPETEVGLALQEMRRGGFRHLPVVEGSILKGIVSERDLREAAAFSGQSLRLSDVMKTDVYIAHEKTPIQEVASKMAQEKYGGAVIVDDAGKVTGIFTTVDALQLLSDLLKWRLSGPELPEDFEDLWNESGRTR